MTQFEKKKNPKNARIQWAAIITKHCQHRDMYFKIQLALHDNFRGSY